LRERARRKTHHNTEDAAVMVRCLEQLRVLLDTSPAAASSSCASVDEAVFSPTSSLSSRDDYITDMSQRRVTTADCRPGPRERFRKLLEHWEAGQVDVVLPARFRFADPHVIQRFSELRRMWESQQATATGSKDRQMSVRRHRTDRQ